MPYAVSAGSHIYYESVGFGQPLVLYHGFSGSGRDWIDDGYVNALADRFQLVLLDARGHGRSDKPTEPTAYAMEQRARDVVAVLDDAEIITSHYLGYSMGGRVGWALGKYAPERFQSIMIGGAGPNTDDPTAIAQWIDGLRDNGMDGVIVRMEAEWGPLPESVKASIRANDAAALLAERIASRDAPNLNDATSQMTMPCLVYIGSDDPRFADASAAAARLPLGEFVPLEGMNHLQAWERLDIVLPVIIDFIKRHTSVRGS